MVQGRSIVEHRGAMGIDLYSVGSRFNHFGNGGWWQNIRSAAMTIQNPSQLLVTVGLFFFWGFDINYFRGTEILAPDGPRIRTNPLCPWCADRATPSGRSGAR